MPPDGARPSLKNGEMIGIVKSIHDNLTIEYCMEVIKLNLKQIL